MELGLEGASVLAFLAGGFAEEVEGGAGESGKVMVSMGPAES